MGLQVHEIPLGEASSLGLPKWDVFIRVRIQASQQLPSPTIHGTLALTLPDSAPTLAASSVKASYVKRKNVVSFFCISPCLFLSLDVPREVRGEGGGCWKGWV